MSLVPKMVDVKAIHSQGQSSLQGTLVLLNLPSPIW